MPALGFDPAPGDVDLTRSLAQRYYLIAAEARQVLALVERLNLSALQGRAADALRAIQDTFPPALLSTVSTAEALQAATSSWASQLSGFQSEADALERQAAAATSNQQALLAQQATLPKGSTVLNGDLELTSLTLTGVHAQAQELHERYLAAAGKTAADASEDSGLWGSTEPVRTVLEAVLAPLDIVAADHWVSALKEVAGQPSDWIKEVDNSIKVVESLRGKGPRIEEIREAVRVIESTGAKEDAWDSFAPGWLKTGAGSIAEIKGLSYTLSALGLVADAGTIISPQDNGTMGWVDRSVAGLNAGLIVADMALAEIPVVGEVALAATGIYLASDYLYHHWTPFRNVANDIGHSVVTAAEGDAMIAKGAGHLATSAWHSVTSSIGSWF
jgi:hypothetical protein